MRRQKFTTSVGAVALAATMALSMMAPVSVAAANGPSAETNLSQSADGKVSKVIGVEGKSSALSYFTNPDTNQKYYYYKASDYVKKARVSVYGDAVETALDKTSGLYVYNGVTYAKAYYNASKDITTFYGQVLQVLGQDVTDANGTTVKSFDYTPYRVMSGDFYKVGDKLYRYLCSKSYADKTTSASVETYYVADTDTTYAVLGTYASSDERDAAKKAAARHADGTAATDNKNIAYYELNGKKYTSVSSDYYSERNAATGKYTLTYYLYAYDEDEITFDNGAAEAKFTWKSLSTSDAELGKDLTADGKKIKIGYQVEVNGRVLDATDGVGTTVKNTDGSMMTVLTSSSYTPNVLLTAANPTCSIRVRGVYYTETETKDVVVPASHEICDLLKGEKYDKYDYNVIALGAWSDAASYTLTAKAEVPAVADVTAVQNGTTIELKWTAVPSATGYSVYTIDSKVALPITAANFWKIYQKDDATLAASGITDKTVYTTASKDVDDPETYYSTKNDNYQLDSKGEGYLHHYYAVLPTGVKDSKNYVNNVAGAHVFGNVAYISYAAGVETPVVKGLRIEKSAEQSSSNSFKVAWDVTDSNADVVVYAYRSKNFPQYYTKDILEAKAQKAKVKTITIEDKDGNDVEQQDRPVYKVTYTANNKVYSGEYYVDANNKNTILDYEFTTDDKKDTINVDRNNAAVMAQLVYTQTPATESVYLTNELTDAERNRANDVHSKTASLKEGSVTFDGLEAGLTYYFVAYTYDTRNGDVERTPILSYNGLNYTAYNDMSAASNMVSYKVQPSNVYVNAKVSKSSVKLTMSTGFTGYEIYKMNKKGKYTKIATVNNNEYTDKDVELGKKYTYKVRPYNYNHKTKVAAYGDYSYVSAVPSAIGGITAKAVEVSKTSAKLKWTKVAKATRYEIYRCDTDNYDRKNLSDAASEASTDKWELVKTIKKAKTVAYKDKKLKAGKDYYYVVRAYYDEKGTEGYIEDSVTVSTYATAPKHIKYKVSGTKAKLTWDKDKFAAGYEISYMIYDAYGYNYQNIEKVVKTKKNTYTIKNIPQGGRAEVTIRSYDKDNCYAGGSSTYVTRTSLAAPSGIKASYSKSKKAVKISWKAVSGAKYYRVYRATYSANYNKDYKKYYAAGVSIAKEANDDYAYDSIVYDEYLGIAGSIVGTTAYDYYQMPEGVTYYYTVVAYGESGTAIKSNIYGSLASGKPAAYTSSSKKMTVKAVKSKKAGQATIKFKKFAGANSYLVLRATKKNGKYEQIAKVSKKKTSYTDKTAKKGKTYYYKVVAVAKNGLKADMNVKSAAKKVKIKK